MSLDALGNDDEDDAEAEAALLAMFADQGDIDPAVLAAEETSANQEPDFEAIYRRVCAYVPPCHLPVMP